MQEFAYWQDMPALKNNLEKVQEIILDQIKMADGDLGEAIRYNFAVAGKELRPAFVILFGEMGRKNKGQRILNIASSVEILHNATLIHDDIIDESPMRRGRSSIQAKYGKHIALYAGDYLFALSLQLLSQNTSKITSLRINSKAMQEILSGETSQFSNEYNLEITTEQYLLQIKGKTAILFAYACYIGAIEGGLPLSLARKAQKFGELVGSAFQLRDDILDYTSNSDAFKKPVLQDVVNGVYSGPLIFALAKDKTNELHDLVKVGKDLSAEQLNRIDQLVTELGGIKQAQSLVEQYTNKALAILEENFSQYPASKNLAHIAKSLLERQV